MLKAMFGSVTFHIAIGVGLFSTAWWWTSQGEPRQPPKLAVSLQKKVPEITQDAPDIEVEPPVEMEPEIIPVVEVEATPLDRLEDLPPLEEYQAVRPWMPQQMRYRLTKLPPHLREKTKLVENKVAHVSVKPKTAEPHASVLLAPQIDAKKCPPPDYPRRARRMRWEGLTQLIITIDVHGNPIAIKVFISSGHQILDDAAIQAVQGWHFHPANRDGTPESGDLLVPIRFDISG